MLNYYFDTCIWRGFLEARKNYDGSSLSEPVFKLFIQILNSSDYLFLSDVMQKELLKQYSLDDLNTIFGLFTKHLIFFAISDEQILLSQKLAQERNLPLADVMHVALARDNRCILVTRDNHFRQLLDVCKYHLPESLLRNS